MLKRSMIRGLVVAFSAVVAVDGAQAFAAAPNPTWVRCTFNIRAQTTTYQPQGIDLGLVTCGKPLGHGVYFGAYKDTLNPPSATETGSMKEYFDRGTLHGTYKFAGQISTGKYTGSAKITGGTGLYQHARGLLKLTCTVNIPAAHCSGSGKITNV
jgi:hypothetical protein